MGLFLILLLLFLLFGGLGFAVHVLWIIAVVLFLVWLFSMATGAGRPSRWW